MISPRQTARIIGGALLVMAALAGIAIPVLGTLTASISLSGIFLLDILVSIGIYQYYRKERPKPALAACLLRLIYTAIFGVAIGYHVAGSVTMFHSVWGLGLIAFGVHLLSLAILFKNEGGSKWVHLFIKLLLLIAGCGYMIQYIGILLLPEPESFVAIMEKIFMIPMILGETLYACWMLLKGGKTIYQTINN